MVWVWGLLERSDEGHSHRKNQKEVLEVGNSLFGRLDVFSIFVQSMYEHVLQVAEGAVIQEEDRHENSWRDLYSCVQNNSSVF